VDTSITVIPFVPVLSNAAITLSAMRV